LLNSIWTDWLPDAKFPYADFAVKHFPDNTARRSLFDHQRKTRARVFYIGMAMAQRPSMDTKNAGDGLTIASARLLP
jgi:hypothetical protein